MIRNYYYPEKEYDGGSFGENYKIKPGRKNKLDIKLKGIHGYQIYVKNINPYNAQDKICFGNQCYIGENVDTLFPQTIISNEYYIDNGIIFFTIEYIVTKNNISTPFQENVYFKYKNITPHEIHY